MGPKVKVFRKFKYPDSCFKGCFRMYKIGRRPEGDVLESIKSTICRQVSGTISPVTTRSCWCGTWCLYLQRHLVVGAATKHSLAEFIIWTPTSWRIVEMSRGAAAAAGVNAQARADGAAADRDNLNAAVNSLITIQRAFENVAKMVDQGRKDVAKSVQVIHTHGNALAETVARLNDTAGKISICTSFTASTFNVLLSKSWGCSKCFEFFINWIEDILNFPTSAQNRCIERCFYYQITNDCFLLNRTWVPLL